MNIKKGMFVVFTFNNETKIGYVKSVSRDGLYKIATDAKKTNGDITHVVYTVTESYITSVTTKPSYIDKSIIMNGYTIKNYKKFRGIEWGGFTCEVLLNGKKVAYIEDDGYGGGICTKRNGSVDDLIKFEENVMKWSNENSLNAKYNETAIDIWIRSNELPFIPVELFKY